MHQRSAFAVRAPRLLPHLLALLLLSIAAQCPAPAQALPALSTPPAKRRITGPVNEQRLTKLPGNLYPLAQASYDAGPVPDSMPQDHILMMLRRSPQREQALEQLMRDQYNPRSPNFHRWLTPEQFGDLYGPSPADVSQVTAWLRQHGFTVNLVSSLFIDFSGTAGQVKAAFHTAIHRYRIHGVERFANVGDPMIPQALAPVVSGFRALNNFHPQPMSQAPGLVRLDRKTGKWIHLDPEHLTSGSGASASYLVGPRDFAQIYGISQVWRQALTTPSGPETLVGTGQTIGVAGDTDLASGDIVSFRDQFGITALGPNGSVMVEHPPASVCPAPAAGKNDPEGYLDAEWAGAMAPDATIDFVACGDQGVTSGADLAAAYIVQDPAHAQKIGVLSTSYGYCEQNPKSESAQFYVALWQQAAAEGITVVVAAGDSGGAECDEFTGANYAVAGQAVNAEASTPYNIAAGGTDFSDTFAGTTAKYWSAANGPNFQSAVSYIPEMPWDDSCASPLVLARFGGGLSSSSGSGGFCTTASNEPIDPNTGFSPYFFLFAGSGGLSMVSPRPAWQTGVQGLPAGSARALPDISMFASSGYAWGHTLLLCDSAFLPLGTACDFSDPNNVYANEDGGTSFVAPAFAGIMALINQKNGRQGQADNVLYPLAAGQYVTGGSPAQPNLATCAAYLGTGVLPSCYFHDISATPNPDPATQAQIPFLIGTTSVPCTGSATAPGAYTDQSTGPASNSENCYGYEISVTQNGSSLKTTPNYYGILSTADNPGSPAFPAAPGYDLATGLGSPNAAALVNAPAWSGLAITTSSLPQGAVGAAYSETLTAGGRVPPYTWSIASGSLPAGLSLGSATGVISGTPTTAGASTFTIQAADSEGTPVTATASFTLTVAPPPGVTVSVSPASLAIPFGGSGTFAITLTPQGGFAGLVTLSCGALPLNLSCSFAQSPVSLTAAGGAITDTLTIRTAAVAAASPLLRRVGGGTGMGIFAAMTLWLPVSFAGLLGFRRRKERKLPKIRFLWMFGTLVLLASGLFAGVSAMSGCGRGSSNTTPDGVYTIPIHATYAGGSQSLSATVHVQ